MLRLARVAVREAMPFWTKRFTTSESYWRRRYAFGGNSGAGSRGASARYKAEFVNAFVIKHEIMSLLDIGCGDGLNASLLNVPSYCGVDIAPTALKLAQARCAGQGKSFTSVIPDAASDMTLSMDVVYHLVEDDAFADHIRVLGLARRYCLIYGTDFVAVPMAHIRHRQVTAAFLERHSGWELLDRIANPLYEDWQHPHFMIFAHRSSISGGENRV